MNGKLCAVKCEDIVTVFKLPTKSVIATYLIYLFPCIIGSYLLMVYLDLARKNLALNGKELFKKAVDYADYARSRDTISR